MKKLNSYIQEKFEITKDTKEFSQLDKEMQEWEERFKKPFGKTLKELQKVVADKGNYKSEDEYGICIFTPFDNYVTAYALDGNKDYTYKHVREICDEYDLSQYEDVQNILDKLCQLC